MKAGLRFSLLLLWAAIIPACQAGTPIQNNTIAQQTTADSLSYWCSPLQNLQVYTLEEDIKIFQQAIEKFENHAFDNTPFNSLVMMVARHFLSTPYVASTLEIAGNEQLVVNLRQMDCTTFVEYVLAISLTIKQHDTSFDTFTQNLACIRYRDGRIDGYPSRLHYFSEWMLHKAHKGVLEMVSDSLGTSPLHLTLNFMSKNPHLYRQLSNREFQKSMKMIEETASSYKMQYIPKDMIPLVEDKIKDGDIIAFTTTIAGLDVTHTGFAFKKNGRLHLLHASTRSMTVEETAVALSDYINPMSKVSGILVGRFSNFNILP